MVLSFETRIHRNMSVVRKDYYLASFIRIHKAIISVLVSLRSELRSMQQIHTRCNHLWFIYLLITVMKYDSN